MSNEVQRIEWNPITRALDLLLRGGKTIYGGGDEEVFNGPWNGSAGATHNGLTAGSPISTYVQTLAPLQNTAYGIQYSFAADLHTLTFRDPGWYQILMTGAFSVNNAVASANMRSETVGGTAQRFHFDSTLDFFNVGEVAGESQTCPTHGTLHPLILVTAAGQTLTFKINYAIAINGNLGMSFWMSVNKMKF